MDLAVSFLPLAHVYERTLDYVFIFGGCPVAYVPVIENVAQALVEVKPTLLGAVPRFFEKIYARLMEQGTKTTGAKRKLFNWSMKLTRKIAPWRCGEGSATLATKLQWALAVGGERHVGTAPGDGAGRELGSSSSRAAASASSCLAAPRSSRT